MKFAGLLSLLEVLLKEDVCRLCLPRDERWEEEDDGDDGVFMGNTISSMPDALINL